MKSQGNQFLKKSCANLSSTCQDISQVHSNQLEATEEKSGDHQSY